MLKPNCRNSKTGMLVRRIPLSRRSHITGFQPLHTGITQHESALERDFVTLVAFADATASVQCQPLTISFIENRQQRRYTPDFLVRWGDGRMEVVEVKYWVDLRTNWERLKSAFEVGRQWAQENGGTFRLATERNIRGRQLEHAKRLLPLRAAPLDRTAAAAAVHIAQSLPEPTFGRIVEDLGGDRAEALATVWRLIARGGLRVDLSKAIGMDAPVLPP